MLNVVIIFFFYSIIEINVMGYICEFALKFEILRFG